MLDGGDASDIKKCNASMNESNILLDSFILEQIFFRKVYSLSNDNEQ